MLFKNTERTNCICEVHAATLTLKMFLIIKKIMNIIKKHTVRHKLDLRYL